MQELNSASLLFVFVRNSVESTLERSTIARERMGLLLQHLISAGTITPDQYYKGSVHNCLREQLFFRANAGVRGFPFQLIIGKSEQSVKEEIQMNSKCL